MRIPFVTMSDQATARLIGGAPSQNTALFHRIRFLAGDPAAFIEKPDGSTVLLIRDIEADRARRDAGVDEVAVPADFTPESGLSGDRATATAQATAECLRRTGATRVLVDRSTPYIYVHHLEQAGLDVAYDDSMGVIDRRAKSSEELDALRAAQGATEAAMRSACELVAHADVADDGTLVHEGETLTSERMHAFIDVFLLGRGFESPGSIVAGGPVGADCHDMGSGPLRTGEPVIIDIFPRSKATRYNGDCTRTVVNGTIPAMLETMHNAVVEAKAAGIAAIRPGATGEAVHEAVIAVIREHGYEVGLPPADSPATWCGMVHGTGHGVGLEVHEPPLLDFKGCALVSGDVLTVEPGLYSRAVGGIRVEDMVAVTEDGCVNFNTLPEGLDWS